MGSDKAPAEEWSYPMGFALWLRRGGQLCDCVCWCVPIFICPWECSGQSPALTSHCLLAPPNPQEQRFCQRYDQLMEAWEKKVERIENNPRRRAKESKVREYYEKQFPEIRKQRELQERMQR